MAETYYVAEHTGSRTTDPNFHRHDGWSSTILESIGPLPDPGQVQGLSLHEDKFYYLTNGSDGSTPTVYVIDGYSTTVLDSFVIASGGGNGGLTNDGTDLYSSSHSANEVHRHDGFSSTILESWTPPLDRGIPTGIAYRAANGDFAVTEDASTNNDNGIYRFDGFNGSLVTADDAGFNGIQNVADKGDTDQALYWDREPGNRRHFRNSWNFGSEASFAEPHAGASNGIDWGEPVAANSPPDKPTCAVDDVRVNEADLSSSAYSDPDGDPHQDSQWQVDESGGDFSTPVHDSGFTATDLESHTATGLPDDTDLIARVRHRDDQGNESEWSDTVAFTTDPEQPDKPTLTVDEVVLTVASLSGSAYSHPTGLAHQASQWQVDEQGDNFASPKFDSGTDTENLESIDTTGLEQGQTYEARVRYQDSDGNFSEWSEAVSFNTQEWQEEPLDEDPTYSACHSPPATSYSACASPPSTTWEGCD